jgi:hypothetical protein
LMLCGQKGFTACAYTAVGICSFSMCLQPRTNCAHASRAAGKTPAATGQIIRMLTFVYTSTRYPPPLFPPWSGFVLCRFVNVEGVPEAADVSNRYEQVTLFRAHRHLVSPQIQPFR